MLELNNSSGEHGLERWRKEFRNDKLQTDGSDASSRLIY